jgi:hypothetical protein
MKVLLFCSSAGLTATAILLASGCSTASVSPGDASTRVDVSTDVSTVPVCPTNPDDLISDFTVDNGITGSGKMGFWYTYGDKSGRGTLVPTEGSTPNPDLTTGNPNCTDGPGSLHVTAMGYVDWGAAIGADFMSKVLVDGGNVGKGTYDASAYRGVSFWAKAAAPVRFVQVSFKTPYSDTPSILTDPASQCVFDSTMAALNCSPYLVKFGYGYAGDATVATDFPAYANYEIDATWKRFEILFADTKQDRYNPGLKPPGDKLDLSQLTGMSIQANSDQSTMPPTANNFEIWIDDVTFIR